MASIVAEKFTDLAVSKELVGVDVDVFSQKPDRTISECEVAAAGVMATESVHGFGIELFFRQLKVSVVSFAFFILKNGVGGMNMCLCWRIPWAGLRFSMLSLT